MTRPFKLPDLGEGIHEAEIREIHVSPGDKVTEGDTILTVETDKASVDVPSPFTGTVAGVEVKPNAVVQVGDVLVTFDGGPAGAEETREEPKREEAEKERVRKEVPEKGPQPEKAAEPEIEREGKPAAAEQPRREIAKAEEGAAAIEGRVEAKEEKPEQVRAPVIGPVPAAPSTRRLARELGVDLRDVEPSGPGGRVTDADVRARAEGAKAGKPAPAAEGERPRAEGEAPAEKRPAGRGAVSPADVEVPPLPDFERWGAVERVPYRSIRREIGRRMSLAWSQIPQATHHDRADITRLEEFRKERKKRAEHGGLTMSVLVMKAVTAVLKEFPRVNASLDTGSGEIVLKKYYNLGMAVDTEQGLVVPVIRNVDRKSLAEIAVEFKALVERTRKGGMTLEDIQGGTFTITNAGTLGGTHFTPIINYPQVAILGMARAEWLPIAVEGRGGGEGGRPPRLEPRYCLPLILGFDHRVLDGADAARFLNRLVAILQDPDELFMVM